MYEARNEEFPRQVALKFIKKDYAEHEESRSRFLTEAEITGRLEHPGIVPIYGIGEDDAGHPCYAMRFIRGVPLEDAIKAFHEADRPALEPAARDQAFRELLARIKGESKTEGDDDLRDRVFRELLNRFKTVCETIDYAHNKRVVHRDLKPNNIMLGKYGETLVVDWGIAKLLDQGEAPTASDAEETLPLTMAPARP